jgi:HTH-type transcriptional regulator/antitoxin HigA
VLELSHLSEEYMATCPPDLRQIIQQAIENEALVTSLVVNGHEPHNVIKTRMEQLGLKSRDIAPLFGSASKASMVLSGKSPLTLSIARELVANLQIPAKLLVAPNIVEQVVAPTFDTSKLPLNQLVKAAKKAGIYFDLPDDWKTRRDEQAKAFMKLASPMELEILPKTPALPRENSQNHETSAVDTDALRAWLMVATVVAKQTQLPLYQADSLTDELLRAIPTYSCYGVEGVKQVQQLLASKGIALVFVPHLTKTYTDGACFRLNDQQATPVIALSLRFDRLDSFYFSLMHELGHLKLHLSDEQGRGQFFADDEATKNTPLAQLPLKEKEADAFARGYLYPEGLLEHLLDQPTYPTNDDLRNIATKVGIDVSLLAGALGYQLKDYRRYRLLIKPAGLRDALFAA